MKHKKAIARVAFLLLGLSELQAQESFTVSGGETTGTNGTVSYSVGQVVYSTNTGTNGSVAQGVQLPFEITTTLGIKNTTIHLEWAVYPNPTTDVLTLKTESNTNLSYQLYDLQGKTMANGTVRSNTTTIKMEGLQTAAYFLNVTDNNQTVKTFKIIKN